MRQSSGALRAICATALLIWLMALAACGAAARADSGPADDLPNVPPPPGGVLDPSGSRDEQPSADRRVAQRVYRTDATADAIATFYRQRLPGLGWQPDSGPGAPGLRYRREIFATGSSGPIGVVITLVITIGTHGAQREVTVITTAIAAPLGGVTPAASPPAATPSLPTTGGGGGHAGDAPTHAPLVALLGLLAGLAAGSRAWWLRQGAATERA